MLCRVLTTRGLFLSITFAQPHFRSGLCSDARHGCITTQMLSSLTSARLRRRPFLATSGYDWSLQVETFGDAFHYFVYRLRRGEAHVSERRDAAPAYVAPQYARESTMHEHMDDEDYLLGIEL